MGLGYFGQCTAVSLCCSFLFLCFSMDPPWNPPQGISAQGYLQHLFLLLWPLTLPPLFLTIFVPSSSLCGILSFLKCVFPEAQQTWLIGSAMSYQQICWGQLEPVISGSGSPWSFLTEASVQPPWCQHSDTYAQHSASFQSELSYSWDFAQLNVSI